MLEQNIKINDKIFIDLKKEIPLKDLMVNTGFDLNEIKNLNLDTNSPYKLVEIITHKLNNTEVKIFKIKNSDGNIYNIPSFIISKIIPNEKYLNEVNVLKVFYNEKDALNSKFTILDIEEDLTLKLFEKIKPIIKKDDTYYTLKPVHPIKEAFTWNQNMNEDQAIKENLIELDTIYILHNCYYALYKGSMEEVFASLQFYPRLNEVDFIRARFASVHPSVQGVISSVVLYKKEVPDEKN